MLRRRSSPTSSVAAKPRLRSKSFVRKWQPASTEARILPFLKCTCELTKCVAGADTVCAHTV